MKRSMLTATAVLGIMPAMAVADEPVVPPLPSVPVIDAALAPPAGSQPAVPVPETAGTARAALAAVPVATAARSCRGVHSRRGIRRQRAAVRCLVNRARGSVGLRGFRRSGSLSRAATRHARDMARRGYFAHQRWGGPDLLRRARSSGWRGGRVGEAIAWGCRHSATPLTVVRNWLGSPPHRAILLSGRLRRSGVGVARAPVSCPGRTYVLDAGRG